MKKHFTNEQIVSALRQAEGGVPAVEVCRRMAITEQTFYRWKRMFAGLGIARVPLRSALFLAIRANLNL